MNEILGNVLAIMIVGILIVSLFQLQTRMAQRNIIDTQSYNLQLRSEILREQIREDIKVAGYNITDLYHSIKFASKNRITFVHDSNENSIPDTVSIFTRDYVTDPTTNPNDFQLIRSTKAGEYDYGVSGLTNFKFTYYDKNNNTTTQLDKIKIIQFEYTLMGQEPVESSGINDITKYPIADGFDKVFIKNIYDW